MKIYGSRPLALRGVFRFPRSGGRARGGSERRNGAAVSDHDSQLLGPMSARWMRSSGAAMRLLSSTSISSVVPLRGPGPVPCLVGTHGSDRRRRDLAGVFGAVPADTRYVVCGAAGGPSARRSGPGPRGALAPWRVS
jgi:hypothetical protein